MHQQDRPLLKRAGPFHVAEGGIEKMAASQCHDQPERLIGGGAIDGLHLIGKGWQTGLSRTIFRCLRFFPAPASRCFRQEFPGSVVRRDLFGA
jgi:hypothetical protein